jgi:hypothetical protein
MHVRHISFPEIVIGTDLDYVCVAAVQLNLIIERDLF